MEVNENSEANVREMVGRKKRKREKRKDEYDGVVENGNVGEKLSDAVSNGNAADLSGKAERKREKMTRKENGDGNIESTKCDETAMKNLKRKKKHEKEKNYKDDLTMKDSEYTSKGKKRKIKIVENGSNEMQAEVEGSERGMKKKMKSVGNGSNGPTPNQGVKKVRFSSENEVFTLPSDLDTETETETGTGNDSLLRGKRFTLEEDEIVRQAVFKYIEDHNLGDEGLDMILNSKKYSAKVRGCWKEIGSAIPYRPYIASYYRAQILFRRSEEQKWTQEEYDLILKHQAEHGNHWRALADQLGKHRLHVKDTWRRIKLPNLKGGHWSQEEYQKLFDLVNTDLQAKLYEEKRSKHGMLRDNICWTAISDELSTRTQETCCRKWYRQLTSPMVAEGVWADVDDYCLISALYSLDATCAEDVDWDDLVDERSGDVCRKRWYQMVRHVGRHESMSFAEKVEVLTHRYCSHLLEVREAWDNKPRVP